MTNVFQPNRRLIILGYDSEMLRLGYPSYHALRWVWFVAVLAAFLLFSLLAVLFFVSSTDGGICGGLFMLVPALVLGWLLARLNKAQAEEVRFNRGSGAFMIVKRSLFDAAEQVECYPFSDIERITVQFSDEENYYYPHLFRYYVGLGLGGEDPFHDNVSRRGVNK